MAEVTDLPSNTQTIHKIYTCNTQIIQEIIIKCEKIL